VTRPTPLPRSLARAAFSVSTALELGVGRGRLSGPDLQRPFHGVRSLADLPRARAYVPRLRPGDRFSHTTALALLGAPLPLGMDDHVHVSMRHQADGSRLGAPKANGVLGHTTQAGETLIHDGLPMSDPMSAFLESANILALDDLVAVGDYLVLDPRVLDPFLLRPLTSRAELGVGIERCRARGAARARAALELVRDGVESPKETALRLLVRRARLPEPVCGFELMDGPRSIGWFDLAWPEFRTIAEYDGDGHRTDKRQYERDIRRYDDAADIEWRVVRVRDPGLGGRAADTITRVERALTRGGWSRRRKRRS
jgi:hypothetical protein